MSRLFIHRDTQCLIIKIDFGPTTIGSGSPLSQLNKALLAKVADPGEDYPDPDPKKNQDPSNKKLFEKKTQIRISPINFFPLNTFVNKCCKKSWILDGIWTLVFRLKPDPVLQNPDP